MNTKQAEEQFVKYKKGLSGPFFTHLFKALEFDDQEFSRLAACFPAEAQVVSLWKEDSRYALRLRKRVEEE